MKDVINQLRENNASEKERDSNLNRNISNLRERNVSGFAELSEALTATNALTRSSKTTNPYNMMHNIALRVGILF